MFGSDLRRVCLMIGGGEGDSSCEVIVSATTLECDGDSVKRMSCVDDIGEMVDGSDTNVLNIGTVYACSVDGGVPGSLCLHISNHVANNSTYPDAVVRKNKIQIFTHIYIYDYVS